MSVNKAIMVRSKFYTTPNKIEQEKGWYRDVFYDIMVKQEGEKFKVIDATDQAVPKKSLLIFDDFGQFCDKFTVHFKYLL